MKIEDGGNVSGNRMYEEIRDQMWKHLVLIFLENMRREGKGEAVVEN